MNLLKNDSFTSESDVFTHNSCATSTRFSGINVNNENYFNEKSHHVGIPSRYVKYKRNNYEVKEVA